MALRLRRGRQRRRVLRLLPAPQGRAPAKRLLAHLARRWLRSPRTAVISGEQDEVAVRTDEASSRLSRLVATLVLVACGLLASGIAVTSIRGTAWPTGWIRQLLDASRELGPSTAPMPMPPIEGPNPARPLTNFYVRGIDPDGRVWMAVERSGARTAAALPTTMSARAGDGRLHRRLDRGVARDDRARSRWRTRRRSRLIFPTSSRRCASLIDAQVGIGRGGAAGARCRGFAVVRRAGAHWSKSKRLPRRSLLDSSTAASGAGPRTEVGRLSLALNWNARADPARCRVIGIVSEHARSSEDRMRRFIDRRRATNCARR